MAAYHRVYDSHHLQADCQTGISSGTLRFLIEYGLLLPFSILRCEFVISAATLDYFEHVNLITTEEDYEPYNSRFPKFLPSRNLHVARAAYRHYRASCLLFIIVIIIIILFAQ